MVVMNNGTNEINHGNEQKGESETQTGDAVVVPATQPPLPAAVPQPPPAVPPPMTRYFIERNNRIIRQANEYNTNNNGVNHTDNNNNKNTSSTKTGCKVVDIRAWVDPCQYTDEDRDRVMDEILKHATSTGSFYLCGHGVPVELLQRLDTASRDFFALPLAEKKRYQRADSHLTGYLEVQQESLAALYGTDNELEANDLRELYGVVAYPPPTTTAQQSPTNIPAPDDFQGAMNEYLQHMDRLDRLLHVLFSKILSKAKGVPLPDEYFEQVKGGMHGLFRSSHYPDLHEKYDHADKLKPHSDWATLTVVLTCAPGLEEIDTSTDADGGGQQYQWRPVHVPAGHLHVHVNDMMHYCSNGLFQNNIHRVSQRATKQNKFSQLYFAANIMPSPQSPTNESDDHAGVLPVCAPGEVPIFTERLSLPDHVQNNLQYYFGK